MSMMIDQEESDFARVGVFCSCFIRVISWIVLVFPATRSDPRNHTKNTKLITSVIDFRGNTHGQVLKVVATRTDHGVRNATPCGHNIEGCLIGK